MPSWIKRKTKTWKSGGITYRRTETFNSKTGMTRKSFSSGNKYSRKTYSTNNKNNVRITNTVGLDGGLYMRTTKKSGSTYKPPKAPRIPKAKSATYKPRKYRTRKVNINPSTYFSSQNTEKGTGFGWFLFLAIIFFGILGSM